MNSLITMLQRLTSALAALWRASGELPPAAKVMTNRLPFSQTLVCENSMETKKLPPKSYVLRSRNQFSFAVLRAISKIMSFEKEQAMNGSAERPSR